MRPLRTALIIAGFLSLAACGFKPMHAPGAFSNGKSFTYADIAVATKSEEKADFLLKQSLRDRFGENTATKYRLEIAPKTTRRSLGISDDDVASRYDLVMNARFDLIDLKSGKSVFKDNVRATSTFAAPRDPYGRISAENNATEQVASETADRIIIRLAGYFESLEAE